MNKVVILVKNKDDFGRKQINDFIFEFEVIIYERLDVGDFFLFLYPEKSCQLFYSVIEIGTAIQKDLPYRYSGKMKIENFNDFYADLEDEYREKVLSEIIKEMPHLAKLNEG